MLFNSYFFILIFLPIVLVVFFRIGGRGHHRAAVSWLVGASLFFYGWWNPAYLGLILGSILFNYALGARLSPGSSGERIPRKLVLTLGVIANLGLLGYYKYANFFVDNLNSVLETPINLPTIILPLAISFFTFQQITYLVDAYRGETREYNFLHYCLFVTFFPQLIAGPIVHHKEMLPQFACDSIYRYKADNLAIGLTIFFIGLFKKVALADGVSVYVAPVFTAAEAGDLLTVVEAWGGALAYTFQLYFDFSGYSDMAIGLARMFGVRLPLNFHSPYKAVNISDFWRRWHMTLSRFLRDYIYIPLGGNRKGTIRRYNNLIVTMLLGGLWHGAGWTFVIWGGLHGVYLVVGHIWTALRKSIFGENAPSRWWGRFIARVITFSAIVVGWVFFRAESFDGAVAILHAMVGGNGFVLPDTYLGYLNRLGLPGAWLGAHGVQFGPIPRYQGLQEVYFLMALSVIVWTFPNTQQVLRRFKPALDVYKDHRPDFCLPFLNWGPSPAWAFLVAIMAAYAVINMNAVSEFLYYQF